MDNQQSSQTATEETKLTTDVKEATSTDTSATEVKQEASAPAPAPAPVTSASKQATIQKQTTTAAPTAPVTVDLAKLIDEVDINAKTALYQIADYMEKMAPKKPLTLEDGARQQVLLYRALTTVINRVEADFDKVFGAVLRLFEEHKKGVFHETQVYRFFEQMQLPENDRKAFSRLLNLIKVAGPVKGRDVALKQVDFNATLQHGITEPGRQRVLAYFGK